MMNKSEIILELKKQKLVVVIRGSSKQEGVKASLACIKGGIPAIEVAYTNSYATQIIEELSKENDFIGAGTVLDAITARNAILAGAKFIVSPAFDKDTAILCNRYQIPYIPGCMTINEIIKAMESGCEIIKLFPGSAFGSKYISSIKAPLPQTSIMVTGGVNLDNMNEWFEAGVDAIGIGGEFNKLAANNEFDKITEIANLYLKKLG